VREGAPPGGDDVTALAAARLRGYVQLYEGATAKLTRSEYHAEDLLDDAFRWWGMAVRDATTAATLAWRAYGDGPGDGGGGGGPGGETGPDGG
jgi:hypothetical protein